MNKNEFKQALELAQSDNVDLSDEDLTPLIGYGLSDFKPVRTTIRTVAKMIIYQCYMFNGNIDMLELNELARLAQKRFIIVG